MKLNIVFLILFLVLSIKANGILDSFSIEKFKEYVKSKGLLELIESILRTYGQDIAIISCEELIENYKGNCKKLVTEYMPIHTRKTDIEPESEKEVFKCIDKFYYSRIIEQPFPKYDIRINLRSNFTENQSNLIYNKIIKRVKDLGPC